MTISGRITSSASPPSSADGEEVEFLRDVEGLVLGLSKSGNNGVSFVRSSGLFGLYQACFLGSKDVFGSLGSEEAVERARLGLLAWDDESPSEETSFSGSGRRFFDRRAARGGLLGSGSAGT
ncbi:hypothetical protein AA313_de0203345 [Arthrobotrys entomopaga]|nr:hypothetical protein AA313_de0203345 [Arthrobotrys entomopaga]